MAPQISASSWNARVALSKLKKIANKVSTTTEAKNQTGRPKGGMRTSPKGLKRFSPTARFFRPAAGSLSQRTSLLHQAIARLKKRKRRARKSHPSYNRHIYKVLNLVHPEFEFSTSSPATFKNIALEAARVARYNEKPTIARGEIETTLRLLMTGELTKYAVWEGTKKRHEI